MKLFSIPHRYSHYAIAVGAGLCFALLGRITFASEILATSGGLLMLCFLVLLPIALGAITVHFTPKSASYAWRMIFGPWITVLLFLTATLVFHLEGMICILIISPLFLVTSLIGAGLYTAFTDNKSSGKKTFIATAFALLPFVAAPLESEFIAPNDFRRVENVILIRAPRAVVWRNIIRVPPISHADLGSSLVDKIGFPRPVEATLSYEGVGGVRHATFERGVEFIETVDTWQPLRRLSFSIKPNTASIPPTTFDEHVTVGGRFFYVLRGTYELV
jgi:hypothetical protein